MPSKEAIIDNIESYTAHQLYNFIKSGIVTFDELVEGSMGYWPSAIRLEVERMLVSHEGTDWEEAKVSGDINTLKNFLASYPESSHRPEARELLEALEQEEETRQRRDEENKRREAEEESKRRQEEETRNEILAKEEARKKEEAARLKAIEDAKKEKERKRAEKFKSDPAVNEWPEVDQEDIASLENFRNKYPDSPLAREARKLINELLHQKGGIKGDNYSLESLEKEINRLLTDKNTLNPDEAVVEKIIEFLQPDRLPLSELMKGISRDHNFLKSTVIKNLRDQGYIDDLSLKDAGIPVEFISRLSKSVSAAGFPPARKVESITRQSTEIYFWGIPSSGKTCAIGSIIRAASSGNVASSMHEDSACQGYGYMNRLRELFNVMPGEVGQLPRGTGVHDFYEMGFDLEDEDGKIHPITMVDLAGELIRIMYKNDADEALNDQQLETLDTLTTLLINNRTKNRKIHVFVIEYGGENRLYEGLRQESYLRGAFNYLEQMQIFDKDTDAIFLMFTMTDRIKEPRSEWVNVLEQYTIDHYLDFYRGLQRICRNKEINQGRVVRVPFTLGEVCFRDFFIPDFAAANHFVKQIINRTASYKPDKLNKIRRGLSS